MLPSILAVSLMPEGMILKNQLVVTNLAIKGLRVLGSVCKHEGKLRCGFA